MTDHDPMRCEDCVSARAAGPCSGRNTCHTLPDWVALTISRGYRRRAERETTSKGHE